MPVKIDKSSSSTSPAGNIDAKAVRKRPWQDWLAVRHYIMALLMTIVTTALYVSLASFSSNQPAPIVFLIPITLSAYWGGLGPGLVSTVSSVLAAWYFIMPPLYSFAIADRVDYVRLASMLLVGTLVSTVSESLHRAKGRAVREISERKEAEKRLRGQFSLMKCITDKSTDSIFVTDSEGRVTFLNPEAERVFGFVIEEIEGKVLHDVIHHHHPDGCPFPFDQCPAVQTFNTGVTLRNYEDVYFRKDGSMVDVLGSTAVLETDSRRLGIVYMLRDMTERKREARAKLRSQKLEALGTIAGGIAHDFNNILAGINGNAHFAMAELGASGPVRECLAQISKAGDRAASLVRRILDFSSPREQRAVVQLLQPIVDEAVKLMRATVSAAIEIHTDFAPDLPPANVDSSQIHHVIVNLMTNAAHAIGERPGRIDARLDAVDVHPEDLSSSCKLREGRYLRLYVGDDGCGIDPMILDRIFDPFFTTKPIGQGTGLGLSIVHGIVTNLSGAVTVSSRLGEGTAFHVYLPAVERPVQKVKAQEPKAPRPHRERVLYVDDEEDLVFLATNRLKHLGCQVTGFTDPEEAFREFRLRPGDFDVVVTDVAMPHMSGFDLARKLLSLRSEIPIVLTTGYIRPEDHKTAEELGIHEIVPKPCRIEDLTGALERLCLAKSSAAGSPLQEV